MENYGWQTPAESIREDHAPRVNLGSVDDEGVQVHACLQLGAVNGYLGLSPLLNVNGLHQLSLQIEDI